jgi:hypothetical protein
MTNRAVSIHENAYTVIWIHHNRPLPVIEEAELYLYPIFFIQQISNLFPSDLPAC